MNRAPFAIAAAAVVRFGRILAAIPARVWLVGVLLLAFAVRVVALDKSDLWLDEAISFYIANKPFHEIVLYTASQLFEHPPGYYLLLHFWIRLADTSEFAMRYLSAFGGVLAVMLSAALAHRWFRDHRKLVLLVALLMAVQPMAVYVGREVRMYGWMMVLALLTVHALDRAFVHNRWRDWGVFLVTIGLSVLFHYLAGLFVIAYALFAVLFWRRLPEGRGRFAVVLGAIFGLAAGWILIQAGPRSTLLDVLAERLREPQLIASLLPVYTHWVLGNQAFYIPLWPALILAFLAWAPAVIGVLAVIRVPVVSRLFGRKSASADLRYRREVFGGLIVLLISVPPVLRAIIFLLPNARHSTMMLGLFVLCTALGVIVLRNRSRSAGVLVLLAVLSLDGYLLVREISSGSRPFSAPLDYVQARARSDEPVVYTHPYDWYQDQYYNWRQLPAEYIPGSLEKVTDDAAKARVSEILAQSHSAWLILYPSVLEPERVERAFNELAFPTEKVWFPGGRAAVRYVSAPSAADEDPDMEQQSGSLVWAPQIRLDHWTAWGRTVAAGDALRLQFEWQRVADLKALPEVTRPEGASRSEDASRPSLVVLTLVGPDGTIWAKRVSAPCNGLCPVSDWTEERVIERQAFHIPADVPPGAYKVRLGWVTEEGAPILGRDQSTLPPQVDLPLLDVQVAEPFGLDAITPSLSQRLGRTMSSGLTLLSAEFTAPSRRAGQTLVIPTQWEVTTPQPALELRLELAGSKGRAQIVQPLGPAWYPAQVWTPPRTIRAQTRFLIPGDLPAGAYRVNLSVIETETGQVLGGTALGFMSIVDRPHNFKLPTLGSPLNADWADGIRLVRIQAPESGTAGEPLLITLVWQASGATDRNWKVFIHLLDPEGIVRAQGDAYPLRGEALTLTWQKDEVLVDTYTISLPPDLPPGSYAVRLGFYDELTGERLPLADGSDSFVLPIRLLVDARS